MSDKLHVFVQVMVDPQIFDRYSCEWLINPYQSDGDKLL